MIEEKEESRRKEGRFICSDDGREREKEGRMEERGGFIYERMKTLMQG